MNEATSSLTRAELLSVMLYRLQDFQAELLHGDFNQGITLSLLPDEKAVQNWVADQLRKMQGNAYSIEREPHVSGEKEPDMRARTKVHDATVAIEIKVAESWTLGELEVALDEQLCGRYLRSDAGRHGILLLVHQETRARGWQSSEAGFIDFSEVTRRLVARADSIRQASAGGPQPHIAVLDVSSCVRKQASKATQSGAST